jgi:hypothetical protein
MIKTILAASGLMFGGSATLGGTDTPVESIDSSVIESVVVSGFFEEVCTMYGQAIPLFTTVLNGDMTLAMEITDAYAISKFETGYDLTESSRLTAEARELFMDYLHGCL